MEHVSEEVLLGVLKQYFKPFVTPLSMDFVRKEISSIVTYVNEKEKLGVDKYQLLGFIDHHKEQLFRKNDTVGDTIDLHRFRSIDGQYTFVGQNGLEQINQSFPDFRFGDHDNPIDSLLHFINLKLQDTVGRPVKVLDIGAAAGGFLRELFTAAEEFQTGMDTKLQGTNVSLHDSRTEDFRHEDDSKHIDYFVQSAEGFLSAQENDQYDFVFSSSTFEHLVDGLSVLKDAYRVTRPGGLLLIHWDGINTGWASDTHPNDGFENFEEFCIKLRSLGIDISFQPTSMKSRGAIVIWVNESKVPMPDLEALVVTEIREFEHFDRIRRVFTGMVSKRAFYKLRA